MPNRPTDPAIEPTRLFDNLSVVGSIGTAVYILQTSEGLILIDAGYPEQIESVLVPGLKALGFDPAKVRYIIVMHGHSDHFGAARYFQDTYETKVFLSSGGLGFAGRASGQRQGRRCSSPRRDQVVTDGKPITLGGTSDCAGAGSRAYARRAGRDLSGVRQSKKHMAGLFGGTVLSAGFVTADGLRDYVKSVQKYARIAADNHVNVEIQNHPLMDGFAARLEQLKKRGAQDPHPFVISESAYAAFLNVMSECSQAQLIRKGN